MGWVGRARAREAKALEREGSAVTLRAEARQLAEAPWHDPRVDALVAKVRDGSAMPMEAARYALWLATSALNAPRLRPLPDGVLIELNADFREAYNRVMALLAEVERVFAEAVARAT